ncbi:MAG: hypothetical protein CMF62_03275 [Magnetococcales bacterium]|nr:hypothetical protein [Magnetococcales bacterium]|tara:strand:- start:1503 stop:2849 length:1347 start_codon:yes stop_codon:yes gene_type:complete
MSKKLSFKKVILNKDDVDMVIYHKNCPDGFGGAYSAWKYLNKKYPTRRIDFIPANHGDKPPDVTNRNVLITDFSYNESTLKKMIEQSSQLVVLDHHKTAMDSLKNIPDKYKVFRMEYSGAYLTWKFFFPEKSVPLLISYIQDRDLWLKKMPLTEEFSAWFTTISQSFSIWDKYIDDDEIMKAIENEGNAMQKITMYNISKISNYCVVKFCKINDKSYMVCFLNSNMYKSDIGNKIITEIYPYADFSAIYSIDDYTNSTLFSLRSTDEHTDVSEIAKFLGGGGHRNASGIKLSYLTCVLPGVMYDNFGKIYEYLKNIHFSEINVNGKIYNTVYLNMSNNKSKVASYLLQTKSIKDDKRIQTCGYIDYIRSKKINSKYKKCSLSIVWNYDGFEQFTWLTVGLDEYLTDEEKTEISTYFDAEVKNNIMIIEQDKLDYKLKKLDICRNYAFV